MVIIVIFLTVFIIFSKNYLLSSSIKESKRIISSPIPSMVLKAQKDNTKPMFSVSKSIFVPYWALGQDNLSVVHYDNVYYFGVSADQNGIIQEDQGYKTLERHNCPNSQECILVLRMLDQRTSLEILQSTKLQQTIITESLQLAQEHFFTGVALDLEISGFVQVDVKEQINIFVQLFSTSAKKDYKTFSFIVYGDVFYRNRPYDVKFIANHSDEVMIMAYDFSKPYGEPGSNFPFDRRSLGEGGNDYYGYDFQTMIADFKKHVDPQKTTVIFGMYGYDWTLNSQGTPLKRAEAITVKQIESIKSLKSVKSIKSKVDNNSKEKKIEYTDKEGQKHVIFYEDEESVSVKTNYLREQGIGSISFWAYSYF